MTRRLTPWGRRPRIDVWAGLASNISTDEPAGPDVYEGLSERMAAAEVERLSEFLAFIDVLAGEQEIRHPPNG